MGLEDFLETKNLIKFAVLGIPLVIGIFMWAPSIKWKILLSIAGLVGLFIALSGNTIGRKH